MVSLHNCSSSEHWHSGFVMERIPARETGVNKALIPPANTCVCATGPRPSWCWTTSNSSLTSLWGVVTWATPIKQGTGGSQCTESGRRYQGLLAETGVKCSKSRRMCTGQADLRWGRGLIKMIRETENRRKPEMSNFYIFASRKQRAAKNSVGVCNQTSGVVKGECLACTGLPWQPPPSGIDMMVRKKEKQANEENSH